MFKKLIPAVALVLLTACANTQSSAGAGVTMSCKCCEHCQCSEDTKCTCHKEGGCKTCHGKAKGGEASDKKEKPCTRCHKDTKSHTE